MRKIIFGMMTIFSTLAMADSVCDKDQTTNKIDYSYCITRTQGSTNKDVIYFMHGAGGDETSWDHGQIGEALAPTWRDLKYQDPIVITVTFGKQWLLADVKSDRQPAYLPAFLDEIIPGLEKKIEGGVSKRSIMGFSMGGYNGAELGLRASNLFERVALMCPGLSVVDPFASDADIEKAIAKMPSTTKPDYVRGIVGWVRDVFGTKKVWSRHDPQALITRAKKLKPAFFVSCSKDDEYGFFEGSQAFEKVAAKKTHAEFVPVEKGGHCTETPESWAAVAKFLARGYAAPRPGWCMSWAHCNSNTGGGAYHVDDKSQCGGGTFKSFKPDNGPCEDL
jgi:pimeloyl-ACP methyl ester carboxylesterase